MKRKTSEEVTMLHTERVPPLAGAVVLPPLTPGEPAGCDDRGRGRETIKDDPAAVASSSSPAVSPQLGQRRLTLKSPTAHAPCEQNDSLILQDGQLRSLRGSNQDLTTTTSGTPAPLSPRPWYKRSVARDEKRPAAVAGGTGTKKKSKSPDNLPEIQPGREGITVKETFEEKYSYFIRKALGSFGQERFIFCSHYLEFNIC
jgi:hypothetical protein